LVQQLSVFLENETGGVADVAGVLAGAGIDIRALALADETDFGILRLLVNEPERAASALKDAGFTVRRTPVVAVQIPDRPGGLAVILDALRGTPVEYMYAFVRRSGEDAFAVFRFEDAEAAAALLQAAGARVLSAEDVQQL
jgi:hypothetical protein